MRLQILHVPGCPGAEALGSRLNPLLAIPPAPAISHPCPAAFTPTSTGI